MYYKDIYDIDEIIRAARQTATDISPADRLEWKMFCCALKVLGYDENTFCALSSCETREALKAWREEHNPGRYATEQSAKAKIIALAKNAGMDLSKFRLSRYDEGKRDQWENKPQRHPKASNKANIPQEATQSKNKPQPDSYIFPNAHVELGAANVRKTALFSWLCKEFGEVEAVKALERYHVGASTHYVTPEGYHATAFPYITARGDCIDFKIMHLNPETGSRKTAHVLSQWIDKKTGEPRETRNSWALAEVNKKICNHECTTQPRGKRYHNCPDWNYCPMRKHRAAWCYFGQHLLCDLPEGSDVAVVESEKTALVASIVYPEFIWVATGSESNLTTERVKPLKPFAVTIFPDRDAANKWEVKARELVELGYNVKLDITLQQYPGESKDDLGDIIINFIHGKYKSTGENLTHKAPPNDEEEAARDPNGNFIPWRFAEAKPTDPAHIPEWITNRAAWRLELREQCKVCQYAQTLGGEFKRCRLNIPDEEAASRKRCRGLIEKQNKII